jgi:hypothetical protein
LPLHIAPNHISPVKLSTKAALALLALSALLVGFLIWNGFRGRSLGRRLARLRAEGVPTTLAELDASYPPVPDAENAGIQFLAAASGFRGTEAPTLELDYTKRAGLTNPPTEAALAAGRAHLATNAAVLSAIHEALLHPRSRYPINLNAGYQTTLPHLAPLVATGKRLGVCAELAAETGQPKLAAQCLIDLLRLAGTLRREPVVISFLVKTSLEGIATTSAERVLRRTPLDGASLTELQNAFADAAATQSYESPMVGELCSALDAFNRPSRDAVQFFGSSNGPSPNTSSANFILWFWCASGGKNRDLRVMVDYFDENRRAAKLPPANRRLESDRLDRELDRRLQSSFLPFAKPALQHLGGFDQKAIRQYSILRCAEVGCSIERWRAAHGGALPPSLDALVPQFLAAAPEDPMDGRPLKLRPRQKGFVVYSIGGDEIDNGGLETSRAATGRGDDTFVIER